MAPQDLRARTATRVEYESKHLGLDPRDQAIVLQQALLAGADGRRPRDYAQRSTCGRAIDPPWLVETTQEG